MKVQRTETRDTDLEAFDDVTVMAEIRLRADKDDGSAGTEGVQFDGPLVGDILKAVGVVDSETEKQDISVGIGERTQAVVVFLPSRVPQRQLHLRIFNL